jgi:hypothetical protein
MPIAKPKLQYTLAEDVDIAGMIWRKGASVFVIPVAKTEGEQSDLFLTPHKQYAKRGSHAPVIRIATIRMVVDGETLVITDQPAVTVP